MTEDALTAPWAAVLWDLDGTLVDTEHYWQAAEERIAAAYGRSWSAEQAEKLIGGDLLDSAGYIRDHLQIDVSPAEIVEMLVDDVLAQLSDEVTWRPGAKELLVRMRARGVRMALVTMSYRRLLDPVLAELPEDLFEVIVTGDIATRGKPHPDPYLQAAAGLGVQAGDCLAVEDSETGSRSAEAAGCTVLVVPHRAPVSPGRHRTLVRDLLTPEAMGMLEAAAAATRA